MGSLVRRDPEQAFGMPRSAGWEPTQLMREMLSLDPFRALSAFAPRTMTSWTPQFDVKETPDSYVILADLPGMQEADIDISLSGNRLLVSGRREDEAEDEGESYFTYERSYGAFSRSFTLPEGIDSDKAEAVLRHGVLTLTLPKIHEVKPRKIAVKKGIVEKVKEKLGTGGHKGKGGTARS
jgi:HSP20 family protein